MLTPPAAFIIILLAALVLAYLLSRLSYRGKKQEKDSAKSYACGEDMPMDLIQPDYSAFFPFAFFFTILHVVTLMVTTVPAQAPGVFAIALLYILGSVTALFILFRK